LELINQTENNIDVWAFGSAITSEDAWETTIPIAGTHHVSLSQAAQSSSFSPGTGIKLSIRPNNTYKYAPVRTLDEGTTVTCKPETTSTTTTVFSSKHGRSNSPKTSSRQRHKSLLHLHQNRSYSINITTTLLPLQNGGVPKNFSNGTRSNLSLTSTSTSNTHHQKSHSRTSNKSFSLRRLRSFSGNSTSSSKNKSMSERNSVLREIVHRHVSFGPLFTIQCLMSVPTNYKITGTDFKILKIYKKKKIYKFFQFAFMVLIIVKNYLYLVHFSY